MPEREPQPVSDREPRLNIPVIAQVAVQEVQALWQTGDARLQESRVLGVAQV